METTDANGNRIEPLPDGAMKMTTPDGRVFVFGKDGSVQINLGSIKRVGFENIFDLKSHVILRDGALTIHQAEFHDGGRVKIAFTADGKLVEFSGQQISQSITADNEIVIRSMTAAQQT